ncbi:RHS repeat domain-containing protein [Treponema pedis]|uniref:RHS repeat domain-containing protein n=1 Tax=Treponema pedis TaxID=409322 RepID=UPI001AF7B9A6|nr:RHS repeat-associated core domain-containing protein [Treponema pedis]QSI04897.1 RHS repeat-associated core domain-containing protein [Treponema pedis]
MKTSYLFKQSNYLIRTAIAGEQKQFIKIAFAVHLSAVISAERYRSDSGALKRAVLTLVYFYIIMIVHKCQQSAKRKLLLNKNSLLEVFPLTIGSGKTMPFGNRWSRYKELDKKVPQTYRVYVEETFLSCDAGDARIFSKEGNMTNKLSTTNIPGSQGNSYPKAELDYNLNYEYDPAYAHRLIHAGTRYYRYDGNGNITAEKDGPFSEEEEFIFTYNYDKESGVYSTDYGFGLDAPKETEQTNPQDLFSYRRNYMWNERNLLTKSSDKNYTVHYRYGEDRQRALKYTEEGRSETLYFNNFFTIHIPIYDKDNPQGLRVHKHIFVGNSRLVTAMTHTDNSGDNEEQKEKRYYYHSDHLGSAQFVTDWKGRQYEHIEYTPYGELWIEEVAAGIDKLPFRFTGKEMDEETGLYYYGARYLDPKYSRWLSGDPALGEYIPQAPIDDEAKKHNENLPGMGGVFNVVNLHVYHYAGNNPVKYTDPDGKSSKAYGIVYISYDIYTTQEYKKINHDPGYIVQNKYTEIETTVAYYGNNEKILNNFQTKNKMPKRLVFNCDIADLPADIQDILRETNDNIIVETEKITTTSYYIGQESTKKQEKSAETIKAIYVVNNNGEIQKVYKNEDE